MNSVEKAMPQWEIIIKRVCVNERTYIVKPVAITKEEAEAEAKRLVKEAANGRWSLGVDRVAEKEEVTMEVMG